MAKETKAIEEEMVTIIIDPKRTNGGIRVNGKNYVGKVKVSAVQADDLMRIQEEYSATIDKLTNPQVKLRNQNIDATRKAFMADPAVYGQHPQFSKAYGLSDMFQMSFISETDRLQWEEERMGLYNY